MYFLGGGREDDLTEDEEKKGCTLVIGHNIDILRTNILLSTNVADFGVLQHKTS